MLDKVGRDMGWLSAVEISAGVTVAGALFICWRLLEPQLGIKEDGRFMELVAACGIMITNSISTSQSQQMKVSHKIC